MKRLLLLASLCFVVTMGHAQTINLDHLKLSWTAETGLVVTSGGRTVFSGSPSVFVAHDKAWTWSYAAKEEQSAKLETRGQQRVLTVTSHDPKLPWQQVLTAGPGDRFTLAYSFKQLAWDDPTLQYEVNAVVPTTNWFVGANWQATVDGQVKTGTIPLEFSGASNPFGNATSAEFSTLFGKLSLKSTVGLTFYDYKQREHLWLGRDGDLPKGVEQKWQVEYAFTPAPFVVGGVELNKLQFSDTLAGERFPVSLTLRRLAGEPEQVTVRLATTDEPPGSDEKTVTLGATPQTVSLSVPMTGAGQHMARVELAAADKLLYQSPALSITVPRLISLRPGRLPYTPADQGMALVQVEPEAGKGLTAQISGPDGKLAEGAVAAGKRTDLPLPLAKLPLGRTQLTAALYRGAERLGTARCDIIIAQPQPNGVVIDNRSRTLLVGGLPFCPQSCYTDGKSTAEVIETEPVWGFNTIAPYLSTDMNERRKQRADLLKMFDRCAQVGLHVQLCIHGASRPPHTDEKWAWLKEEIEAFRNHPALLSYYLADEPELGWAKPEDCEIAYRKIKDLDPWHPVTMVFCQSEAAARYAGGMDVCMTDPYPIPNGPVTNVSQYCDRIERDLGRSLALWVVPQAFGGGEWWKREPSRQEMRVMTYLSLIHGARGIQYFIRRPPSANPSSPDLWSECRRLMLELSQLTPELASPEPQPRVKCETPSVDVAAIQHDGAITLLCANTRNEPQSLALALPMNFSGNAEVVFENRTVPVNDGRLADVIDAMSTRVYRLQVQPTTPDQVKLDPRNLIVNPSWEEAHNVGTPDGSYIGYNGDNAASWYVDPRTAVHGRQSLRLTTPVEGKGIGVAPFPIKLEPGKKYVASIWARGDRDGQKFRFAIDTLGGDAAVHELTTQWREYRAEFTASDRAKDRQSGNLSLISSGQAWFDALQIVPLD